MGKKPQTIYELLSEYSEKEIDDVIESLLPEEKEIIKARYGDDLHHPQTGANWDKEKSKLFYGSILPKIRKLLAEKRTIKEQEPVTLKTPTETIDQTMLLIQMLSKGTNHSEICDRLGIESRELYEELLNLKNRGFLYSRKYYSDGSIKYNSMTTIQELKDYQTYNQDRTIITDSEENEMKMLVISDLHFGNELERLDLIDRSYNYCVKNGINIILCGGDLIDGSFTQGTQNISNLYHQIEYFIKNYPHDKSILTFCVAGDHDLSAYKKASINIIDVCNNYRHDVIIGGYNNSGINLKNDKIHLYHHIDGAFRRRTTAPIILHGHAHKYSTTIQDHALNVTIPTLSGIHQPMPSALELNVYFDKGYISSAQIKQLYFGSQDVVLGESTFDLLSGRKLTLEPIKNVEAYKRIG